MVLGGAKLLCIAHAKKLIELMSSSMLFLLLFLSASLPLAFSLRIKGSYDVSNETLHKEGQRKFKFLDKFGIFKGDSVNLYGSVDITGGLVFAFIKEEVWEEFHPGSSCDQLQAESMRRCRGCFVQSLALPSPNLSSGLTPVSSSSSPLSPSASHSISLKREMGESTDTQFWFAVFIYCREEDTISINSTWTIPNDSVSLSYEIFIVNADHDHNNDTDPFTRQFPGNEKGFLFTYLVFSALYAILIPVHLLSHLKYTIKCRTPQIINLFSLALVFEGINIFCGLIHYGVYAHNGYGAPPLNYMKTFFNLVGDWFLIIVLVLIAGGWMVTLRTVKWRVASFIFISLYIFITIIYYIATVVRRQRENIIIYFLFILILHFFIDIHEYPALGYTPSITGMAWRNLPNCPRLSTLLRLVPNISHPSSRGKAAEAPPLSSIIWNIHSLVLVPADNRFRSYTN